MSTLLLQEAINSAGVIAFKNHGEAEVGVDYERLSSMFVNDRISRFVQCLKRVRCQDVILNILISRLSKLCVSMLALHLVAEFC